MYSGSAVISFVTVSSGTSQYQDIHRGESV